MPTVLLKETESFDIDLASPGVLLISCWDFQVARKLQRLTGTFKDYTFKPGDEAMYKVNLADFKRVGAKLGLGSGARASVENLIKMNRQIEPTRKRG